MKIFPNAYYRGYGLQFLNSDCFGQQRFVHDLSTCQSIGWKRILIRFPSIDLAKETTPSSSVSIA